MAKSSTTPRLGGGLASDAPHHRPPHCRRTWSNPTSASSTRSPAADSVWSGPTTRAPFTSITTRSSLSLHDGWASEIVEGAAASDSHAKFPVPDNALQGVGTKWADTNVDETSEFEVEEGEHGDGLMIEVVMIEVVQTQAKHRPRSYDSTNPQSVSTVDPLALAPPLTLPSSLFEEDGPAKRKRRKGPSKRKAEFKRWQKHKFKYKPWWLTLPPWIKDVPRTIEVPLELRRANATFLMVNSCERTLGSDRYGGYREYGAAGSFTSFEEYKISFATYVSSRGSEEPPRFMSPRAPLPVGENGATTLGPNLDSALVYENDKLVLIRRSSLTPDQKKSDFWQLWKRLNEAPVPLRILAKYRDQFFGAGGRKTA